MEARWKKRNRPETQTLPEGEQALTTEPKIDIKAVRKVKIESIIGIVKSFCDAVCNTPPFLSLPHLLTFQIANILKVTAMSILHPVTIGKYRIFICSCGLFAGSVGLIQNWNAIKA